jgi:hypothetical protein
MSLASLTSTNVPPPFVQGITLYCDGDRTENGKPELELVTISPRSTIFNTPVCEISKLIGFPLQIMRVHTPYELNHSNSNATFLKIRCKTGPDPEAIFNAIGYAPDEWQVAAGNVIVARADRKPLRMETLQILCDFCEVRMMRVFQEAGEQYEMLEEAELEKHMEEVVKQEFTTIAFRVYADEYALRERKHGRWSLYDGRL